MPPPASDDPIPAPSRGRPGAVPDRPPAPAGAPTGTDDCGAAVGPASVLGAATPDAESPGPAVATDAPAPPEAPAMAYGAPVTVRSGFGARVAERRERAGLSQGALARATGLSQPAISFIEAGSRTPGIDTARVIADALGVTVGELLGERHPEFSAEELRILHDLRTAPTGVREEVAAFLAFRIAGARRDPPS